MRKLFWCCAALAVAAAGGIYAAALHTRNDSADWLGRWVRPVAIWTAIQPGIAGELTDAEIVEGLGIEMGGGPVGRYPPGFNGSVRPRLDCPIVIDEEETWVQTGVGIPFPLEGDPAIESTCRQAGATEECEVHVPVPLLDAEEAFVPVQYASDCPDRKAVVTLLEWWLSLFRPAQAEQLPPVPEESESYSPGQPPSMREDPHYHHQYPGCPYTGCPYTGRCPQPIRELLPPQQPEKPKRTPKSAESIGPPHLENELPGGQSRPEARRYLRLTFPRTGSSNAEDCPVHFEVDTMECRQNDLKPSERGLIPF
jgi:hypothetical protein